MSSQDKVFVVLWIVALMILFTYKEWLPPREAGLGWRLANTLAAQIIHVVNGAYFWTIAPRLREPKVGRVLGGIMLAFVALLLLLDLG